MLTKTQMKHEIVGQSALSLLASGIRFMEIPQLYPTFDNVFEHAFKECDVLGIVNMKSSYRLSGCIIPEQNMALFSFSSLRKIDLKEDCNG